MDHRRLVVLLVAVSCIYKGSSGLEGVAAPLYDHIKSRPGLHLIPIQNAGDRLNVSIFVGVQNINNVDRVKNHVDATLLVDHDWATGISWNPEDFNGISSFVVPKSDIWTPDIIINNAVSSVKVISPPEVILIHRGVGVFKVHFRITLACDVSEDKCMAQFRSASFPNDFLVLKGPQDIPFDLTPLYEPWINKGGRFRATNGKYDKREFRMFEENKNTVDIVTFSFSIQDTQRHYRNGPSTMIMTWK